MRVLNTLKYATQYLERSGISDAGADAELLVLHAAGIDRMAAYRDDTRVDDAVRRDIMKLLERRAKGEPVQYILGWVDFLGLRIEVGRGVLIPRPETELVAEEAMRLLRGFLEKSSVVAPAYPRILDLCSGSGCISLALGKEFPGAVVFGTDISATAINYSVRNGRTNGISNVTFIEGSLYDPVKAFAPFELIISNPPYIVSSDLDGLQREIREWEPRSALDGGADGLDFYRKIFSEAKEHLAERGLVILELGFGQSGDVARIALKAGFGNIGIKKDMAGIERVLTAEKVPVSQSSHLQG